VAWTDPLERLETGLTRMTETLERLLVALDELDADVTSLGSAVGPLGRLAQRVPGRGRREENARRDEVERREDVERREESERSEDPARHAEE
jgi:hypothetical protein